MNEIKYGFLDDYPVLKPQWDFERNNALGLFPDRLSYGSNKKVCWQCPVGKCHSWKTAIKERTRVSKNTGCPYCAGKKVCQIDYCNTVKGKRPDLAKPESWDYIKNEGKRPEHYTPKSHQKIYWKCPKGIECHSWKAVIYSRTELRIGCPYCAGKQVCQIDYCNTVKGKYPDLAEPEQWDYVRNEGKRPEHYTPGSHQEIFWLCPTGKIGHAWKATIHNRISRESGCPFCNQSKLEKATQEFLDKIQISYIPQHTETIYPYDFYIPSKSLYIELQGEQHFIYGTYYNTKKINGFGKLINNDLSKFETACDKGNYLSISYLTPLAEIPCILQEVLNLPNKFARQYITKSKFLDFKTPNFKTLEDKQEILVHSWYTYHISCVNAELTIFLFACDCGAIFADGILWEEHTCEFRTTPLKRFETRSVKLRKK